jgi:hypothetical protein
VQVTEEEQEQIDRKGLIKEFHQALCQKLRQDFRQEHAVREGINERFWKRRGKRVRYGLDERFHDGLCHEFKILSNAKPRPRAYPLACAPEYGTKLCRGDSREFLPNMRLQAMERMHKSKDSKTMPTRRPLPGLQNSGSWISPCVTKMCANKRSRPGSSTLRASQQNTAGSIRVPGLLQILTLFVANASSFLLTKNAFSARFDAPWLTLHEPSVDW